MPPEREWLAASFVSLALLILSLTSLALPLRPIPASQQITPEYVRQLDQADTRAQRRAHQVLVIGASVSLVAFAASRRLRNRFLQLTERSSTRSSVRDFVNAMSDLIVAFVLALSLFPIGAFLQVLAAALGLLWTCHRFGDRRWMAVVAAAVVLLYASVVIVPGFLSVPDLSHPLTLLRSVEWHYSITMSHGDRLSQGLRLFDEIVPQYGVLGPAILAAVERATGLLSFAGHIRIVQVMQVAFCVVGGLAYLRWNCSGPLPLALVVISLLAWAHPLHDAVLFPNQSGWRYFGLAVGMLLLVSVEHDEAVASTATVRKLGSALGAFAIFNPETSIALGASYANFTLLSKLSRGASLPNLIGALVNLGAASAIVPLAFFIVFRFVFGEYPLPHGEGWTAYAGFLSGYGGMPLYFHLSWIFILCHALVTILHAALTIETIDRRGIVRASVAAGMLVWFAYFFNRAHPWNLWTLYFLYGFLLLDQLSPESQRDHLVQLRNSRFPLALTTMVVFIGWNADAIKSGAWQGIHAARTPPVGSGETRIVSGVRLSKAEAALVEEQSAFVRKEATQAPLAFFTQHVFLVPLESAVIPHQTVADAYGETFNAADFERLVGWFEHGSAAEILFDDPASSVRRDPDELAFFSRLKARIARWYTVTRRESGWEVWTKIVRE